MQRKMLALSVMVLTLAACGGSSASKTSTTRTRYEPSAAQVASCTHAGKAILIPADFAPGFPLPTHSAITATHHEVGGTVIHGYVPSPSFDVSLRYFMREVPKAGYHITDSDSEPPREGEATWKGKGYVGRWRINAIPGCKGALLFEAFSMKSKP